MKSSIINRYFGLLLMCLILGTNQSDAWGADVNDGNNPVVNPTVINNLDSVCFDISQAVFNGTSVEFPIYFKSDDVVNAIGFAFTFDETVLEYDTILVLANYFDSPIFSYNQNDSVVRFEAFSIIQPITHDTALVKVRFNVLAGQLCDTQIDSIWTSLNGDVCSSKIEGCQTIGLKDVELEDLISIYPNPTANLVYIEKPVNASFEIMDINGRQIPYESQVISTEKIAVSNLGIENGIYLIKVIYENSVYVKKVVIQK